jgi:PAS domain S-box-containing protein
MQFKQPSDSASVRTLLKNAEGIENSLKQAVIHWQNTFDALADCIWLLDKDQNIIRSNAVASKFFSKPVDTMLGRHCWQVVHGTSMPSHDCPVLKMHASHQRESNEIQLGDAWMEVTVDPILDESGEISGIVHIVKDISGRKYNEIIQKSRLHLLDFATNHSLDELLQETLDEMERLTRSEIGFFHFLNDDQRTLSLQTWSTKTKTIFCKAEEESVGKHYNIENAGVWIDCVYEKKPVIHNDYASLPHKKGMPEGHAVVVREMTIPVFRDNKIVCVLGVGNKAEDYTEKEAGLIAALSDHAWDIIQNKKTEETLAYERNRLEQASSVGNVALWEWNIITGELRWSESIDAILGYEPGEFKHNLDSWKEILFPEDKNRVFGILDEHLNQNKPYVLDYRVFRKDNTVLWWSVIGSVTSFKNSQPVMMSGVCTDITERVMSEKLLAESEARFRRTFDQSPVGAAMVGFDKSFIKTNKAFCSFLGYTETELYGKTISEITYFEDEQKGVEDLRRHLAGEIESSQVQKRYVRKDGKVVWGEVTISLIRDSLGKPLYFLPIIQDITDRKNIENELIELNATKDKFMSMLAHDLKSPFNVILGFSDLLMENIDKYDKRTIANFVEKIHSSSESTFALLENLLEWARTLQGRIPYNPENIHLHSVVNEVLTTVLGSALGKEIKILINVNKRHFVHADRNMLKTIIRNLLSNAIKFSYKNSEVTVNSSVHGEQISISVVDHGTGMPEETREKLFKLGDNQSVKGTEGERGTGLGLILCKEFTERHNGNIEVISEPGKGSTFCFTMPVLPDN